MRDSEERLKENVKYYRYKRCLRINVTYGQRNLKKKIRGGGELFQQRKMKRYSSNEFEDIRVKRTNSSKRLENL
jgi:hypothetical protein